MSKTHASFEFDLKRVRNEARHNLDQGSVTPDYPANRKTVLKLLNDSLATELVCVLRYKRHHFMAKGIESESVAAEFLQHATEEQQHADMLAARIVQLGRTLSTRRAQVFDLPRLRMPGGVGYWVQTGLMLSRRKAFS